MCAQISFEDLALQHCYVRLDGAGDPLAFMNMHISWDGLHCLMSKIRFERDSNGISDQ